MWSALLQIHLTSRKYFAFLSSVVYGSRSGYLGLLDLDELVAVLVQTCAFVGRLRLGRHVENDATAAAAIDGPRRPRSIGGQESGAGNQIDRVRQHDQKCALVIAATLDGQGAAS